MPAAPSLTASLIPVLLLGALIACAGSPTQADGGTPKTSDRRRPAEPQRPAASGTEERSLTVGKRDRFYELYVPSGYEKGTPAPVVMVWHGGGGFPAAVAKQSHMNEVAEKHGFLVVYPAGSGVFSKKLLTFNAGACCGYASKKDVDDVEFAVAVLDDLAKDYSIDRKRVYSTGISNGAMISYRLACEIPDRIAAIGPVSGVLGVPCSKSGRPVPVIHFHGTADENSPYGGGKGEHSVSKVDFRSAPDTVRFFMQRNGCPKEPASTRAKGSATEYRYGPCRGGSEVVFWSIKGGGHSWPGGDWASRLEGRVVGPVNRDIFASELMWQFFEKHPMK